MRNTIEKIIEEKNQGWIPKLKALELNISVYKQQWFHWAILPILKGGKNK